METVAEYNNLKIPDWALSYLVNADDSGITEEDKKLVDDFMQRYYDEAENFSQLLGENHYVIFSVDNYEDEPYFSQLPKFGLACNVQECTILIVK